jgi:hypothetical protein
MKTICSFFIVALCAQTLQAQPKKPAAVKPADIVVTPGVGIGALKLGMSESEAVKVLGGEPAWTGYAAEMNSFKQFSEDFAIDSIIQFIIGFDSAAKYNTISKKMPVYSLFFKAHRLNFITVTSYGSDAGLLKRIVMKNGLRFYDPMQRCMSKMNKNYLSIRYGSYDGDHIYYKEGVELTYEKKRLVTICIFPPTPDFKSLIAEKRDALIAAFEAAGKEEEEN